MKRKPAIIFENINANHTINVVFAAGADNFDLPIDFSVVSSLKNISENQLFMVYPNPAKSKLQAKCPKGFQILSIAGQVLLQSSTFTNEIDLSSLKDGVYLLKSEGQIAKFTKKS